MKGIDNIVKAILDDAKADVKATKDQTKTQIKQLKDKADTEVKKQTDALQKETEKKSVELVRREKTIMDVEIRRNHLMVKRDMVDKAFEEAFDALCKLSDRDYHDVVKNMMLESVETGSEKVLAGADAKIDQKLIDEVNKELKAKGKEGSLTLSKDKGDFTGGFVLMNKGIETNCTFKMLINQIKPKIESEVANILFG
ncbi:MAG: V-type ATP synthase subunit E family protein [Eubacteriales bacterium]